MAQIGMLGAQCEHLTLDQSRVHIVVLQHNVLLETLDGIVICRVTQLSQQHLEEYIYTIYIISCTISFWKLSTHLAEASFAQHGKKMKIIYRIILKSRYYCGWRGETSGFLEL